MAHNEKVAADKTTADYWVEYFGDYGRMLTRDIPRVIKAAVLPQLKRAASSGDREFVVTASSVVPMGYRVDEDGGVSLDGILRVAYTTKGQERTAARLFCATFSADGELTDIDHRSAPAV